MIPGFLELLLPFGAPLSNEALGARSERALERCSVQLKHRFRTLVTHVNMWSVVFLHIESVHVNRQPEKLRNTWHAILPSR
jgi:hypothetical protein